MKFSRTQKPNALKIKTKGSREKEFSPRFRVTTPRPPCLPLFGNSPQMIAEYVGNALPTLPKRCAVQALRACMMSENAGK